MLAVSPRAVVGLSLSLSPARCRPSLSLSLAKTFSAALGRPSSSLRMTSESKSVSPLRESERESERESDLDVLHACASSSPLQRIYDHLHALACSLPVPVSAHTHTHAHTHAHTHPSEKEEQDLHTHTHTLTHTHAQQWRAFSSHPLSHTHFARALQLMNAVSLADLALSPAQLSSLSEGQAMTIAETPFFELAVFLLPRGRALPLHDHPGMIVCSKILAGAARVRAFSAIESPSQTTTHTTCDGVSPVVPMCVRGEMTMNEVKDASSPAWFLTPVQGNFHEISPLTEYCVMLDVLLPPYHDRLCSFYVAMESRTKSQKPLSGSPSQPTTVSLPPHKSTSYSSVDCESTARAAPLLLRPMSAAKLALHPLPMSVPYCGFRPLSVEERERQTLTLALSQRE